MSFNFVTREALRGLGRNLTMTMALIITTAISLALLATGFLVTTMTERTKDIYLDRVKTKYSGLSGTELAISESQERMAVVLDKKDMAKFIDYCRQENIEVSHIADVTDSNRLRMYLKDEKIVDISRQFIDSAGARHTAKAKIAAVELRNPFVAVF